VLGEKGKISQLAVGSWQLAVVIGHWALGIGHWALGMGHWALGIGHWALDTERSRSVSKYLANNQEPITLRLRSGYRK